MDLPAVIGAISKSDGVLGTLYSDLAQPGVKQVGQALGTVLQTANLLLLPLRMLNARAAEFERRNFEQIAKRFESIPEERVVEVTPEIGVPLLDNLSKTQDPDLRALFIELLASAADSDRVALAHPSFVRVIENLSPDEAILLREWFGKRSIPCLSIERAGEDRSYVSVRDVFVVPPSKLNRKDLMPVYLSNLEGMGILQQRMDRWLTSDTAYSEVIDLAKNEFPGIKDNSISLPLALEEEGEEISEGDITYGKGVIEILAYGRFFQQACAGRQPTTVK